MNAFHSNKPIIYHRYHALPSIPVIIIIRIFLDKFFRVVYLTIIILFVIIKTMRLTREGEYGIRCVLYLAGKGPGRVAGRREIAEAMDIPYHFLGKIGPKLAGAGIIEIRQGAKGGYVLARSAQDISLLDVVETIEGKIFFNFCVLNPNFCPMNDTCTVHPVWVEVSDTVRNKLASVNFAQLSETDHLDAPV